MVRELSDRLKRIPSVEHILNQPEVVAMLEAVPRRVVVDVIRRRLDEYRNKIKISKKEAPEIKKTDLVKEIVEEIKDFSGPSLTRAINGLGVILHTGLGRAPLSPAAKEALQVVSEFYSNLAIDKEAGRRAERYRHVERLLNIITGAEAACVVNNNAAATLLVLDTLAKGREVIVSRGHLIEIGGSFRIPEIMAKSGAIMVEVGTTNRTHLRDYQNAIGPNTAALLKVHTSNYKIVGFVAEVSLPDLVQLAREKNLVMIDDLGSGALIDLSRYGLPKEPTVQDSIQAGADIVCFSGDKLIGGPQAGIIVGRKRYIDPIKKNPLTRAMRCCKLTYAALEATLRLFLDEKKLFNENTTLGLITKDPVTIKEEASSFAEQLRSNLGTKLTVTVREDLSEVGGGSLATESLPTTVVAIIPKAVKVQELAYRLRNYKIPIFGRVTEHQYLLDFRTIRKDEGSIILAALKDCL